MGETHCPRCGGLHEPGAKACGKEDLVGVTLPDGLHVLERLGDTSLGTLYRATYSGSGAEVELVLLGSEASRKPFSAVAESGTLWDQLVRASALKHPNIATVRSVGETPESDRYVTLEILQGELLSEALRRQIFPLDEAVDLILQAAAGLQVAHEAGLIHGNLSPNTILLTRGADQRILVKLIRFGLAQNVAAGVWAGESTDYAAPERLAGRQADERSDVFSLGAVLHHLLAGAPPSADRDDTELIPEPARQVLSTALDPLPKRRFSTVAAFGRALAGIVRQSDRNPQEGGHRRHVAWATAALLGALTVTGVWLLRSPQRPWLDLVGGRGAEAGKTSPAVEVPPAGKTPLPAQDTVGVRPAQQYPTASRPTPKASYPRAASPVPPRPSALPAAAQPATARAREPERRRAPEAIPPARAAPPASQAEALAQSGPIQGPEQVDEAAGQTAVDRSIDSVSRTPASPAPAGPVRGYAPESEDVADGPESRSLVQTDAMRRVLSDVTRLGIVANYQERRPGLLVLTVGRGYYSSASVEYNLKQLYAAYLQSLGYRERAVLELRQSGRKIGEYTRDGLLLGAEYSEPRPN